jgi:hypothetical protein
VIVDAFLACESRFQEIHARFAQRENGEPVVTRRESEPVGCA